PIQGVVGGPELGATRSVFVKGPNGQPEERAIKVGLINEKMAEIREGLKEGEEVVLNPRVLVGDKMKTRQPGDFEKKKGETNGNGGEKGAGAPGGAKPQGGASPGAGDPGAGSPGAGGPHAAGAGGGRQG